MKEDYFYIQSGVIPYRVIDGDFEVLLITSSSGRRWGIPKGIVEPHLTPAASAEKEALEEAGIEGTVHTTAMGTYERPKWGGICTVEVFLMDVDRMLEEWPEDYRERTWLTIADAVARIEEKALQKLLRRAPRFLESLKNGGT